MALRSKPSSNVLVRTAGTVTLVACTSLSACGDDTSPNNDAGAVVSDAGISYDVGPVMDTSPEPIDAGSDAPADDAGE